MFLMKVKELVVIVVRLILCGDGAGVSEDVYYESCDAVREKTILFLKK